MPTDPVTLILTSAVVSALLTSAVNGFITWKNTTRTIANQADQTRQTIDHQATQTQQTLTQQAEQTRRTLAAQMDQARLTDARALRDAKRERLRGIYARVMAAAWAMNDLTIDEIGVPDETPEQRKDRLAPLRKRAGGDVDDALVLLALERDADTFRDAFFALRRTYEQQQRARHISDDPHDIDWANVRALKERVQGGVGGLERLARQQLHELDRELPAPPDS